MRGGRRGIEVMVLVLMDWSGGKEERMWLRDTLGERALQILKLHVTGVVDHESSGIL